MIWDGVRYSIEFTKLILVVVCIMNIKVKKSINIVFALSVTGVMVISHWIELSKYSFIYGIIAFVVFFLTLYKKKNIGLVILAYVGISIIDMFIANICINIFQIPMTQMMDDYRIAVGINTVSLIGISVLSGIFITSKREKEVPQLGLYLPVFIIGGVILSVYLTASQFIGMEEKFNFYQKKLIFSGSIFIIIYSVVCYLLIKKQAKYSCLQIENDMNQQLLQAQNNYFSLMLKKENETKMFRHDIRGHIVCMQMLYEEKKYDELKNYLEQMEEYTRGLSPKIVTGNMYIDMILADLSEKFSDVTVKWNGKMPEVSITAMDVCTLFYNLLNNAFEAADKVLDKSVKVVVKVQDTNIMIIMENHYEEVYMDKVQGFLSTKKAKGHGYGIKSIKKCVDKYNGFCTINTENKIFSVEIVLPNVVQN